MFFKVAEVVISGNDLNFFKNWRVYGDTNLYHMTEIWHIIMLTKPSPFMLFLKDPHPNLIDVRVREKAGKEEKLLSFNTVIFILSLYKHLYIKHF